MYRIFLTTIFIVLLSMIWEINCFGKRRNSRKENKKISKNDKIVDFYNPPTESEVECIDPHCSCGTNGLGIVQKIPYLPISSCYDPVDINLSSACIRCGLCLAVAEQINQTLLETHDIIRDNHWLNDTEISSLMESICNHGFRHYSLREIGGKRYICDRIPGATLVTSTADGLWETNLKTKCITYVSEMGSIELYKHWQRWCDLDGGSPDLNTILCRGEEGFFRDCKSIPNFSARPEPKKDNGFFSKIKVMVELKCQ